MKRKAITLALAVSVAVGGGFASASYAVDGKRASTPEQALEYFFEAEMAGDAVEMSELVEDPRFSTLEDQRAYYQVAIDSYKLTGYKIISTKKIDEGQVEFVVRSKYEGLSSAPDVSYVAIKEGTSWRLEMHPVVQNLNPKSPEYGTTKKDDTKIL